MAKEKDQAQAEIETTDGSATETQDGEQTPAAALKTSEAFDKRLDEEGVEADGDEETTVAAKTATQSVKGTEGDEDAAPGKETRGASDAEGDEAPTETNVSKELVKRATDLGLNSEEIARFADDAELTRTLDILDAIIADNDAEEQAAAQPAAQSAAKPAAKTGTDGEDQDGFKFTFRDEEAIDPELLDNIKGMQKYYQDQVKTLREQLEGVTGNIRKGQQAEFMARFDGMIEKLGTELSDVFGQGSSAELSTRSNAYKNRAAVRTRMYAFAKGLNDAGQAIPDEQQLFEMAVNSLHGQKLKTIAGARMHTKTSERAKQALGRPAARRTGSLTPDQKAVETSRKFDELIDTTED